MGIPEPSTDAGRVGLRALVAEPRSAVVALDFDGTLAPIVADPAAARAEPAAVAALRALLPLVGGVVVVTGRPAAVAVEYGGFEGLGLTVLGQYGAERWEAGVLTAPEPPPGVAAARAELPSVLGESGAWVEDKGRALAVHTRRTADPQALLEQLRAPLADLAARHGLMVEPGRYVLELRPPGVDKGGALTEYLAGRPGTAAVLYAGDDLGDLPAYEALELRRKGGGPAVLVCSSAVTGERQVAELADRADLLVPGPAGVAELLQALAGALR